MVAAGRWGEGTLGEECREQGPLSPSRLAFSSLSFFLSVLRLGVTAPVCASCSNSKVREERGLFVLMTVSRPLWVEMFNHSPVAVTSCSRGTLVIIKNRKATYFWAQITLLQCNVSGERVAVY